MYIHTYIRWVGPARGEIGMRLVQFSKDGTESMAKVPGAPRYVAPPSPEVDQGWDKLTFGELVLPYLQGS
jgi:hypothetical protein